MRAWLGVAAIASACSQRTPAILFNDEGQGRECFELDEQFFAERLHEAEMLGTGDAPDHPRRYWCTLTGVAGSRVGYGSVVVYHRNDDLVFGACRYHLYPTQIRGPVALDTFARAMREDPYAAFAIHAVAAGIDPNREFERELPFVGGTVVMRQFQRGEDVLVEAKVDICQVDPDAQVVKTDGRVVRFPPPPSDE